jgi:FKBP-type peptidyl-prolyl cis-trans isomerase
MARYSELKTSNTQRIVIWVIAATMLVGTVAGSIVMIATTTNKNLDKTTIEANLATEAQNKLTALLQQHYAKVADQNKELSTKYFSILNEYKPRAQAFSAIGIADTSTEDLLVGDGAEITADNGADYAMYYIGWKPNGTIFDSSFDDTTDGVLKSPLTGAGSYITGWNEGVLGMKIGGVREITMPADKGYGSTGSGCDANGENCSIEPDAPLKFIVLAVSQPAALPYAKGTLEACKGAAAATAAQYGMTAEQYCQAVGYGNEE